MTILQRTYWWMADYLYAAKWQLSALWRRQDPQLLLRGSARPVLILPGVYEPWRFMMPIITDLTDRGHPVHILDPLRYNRVPVADGARLVGDYLAAQDLTDVAIVAHSKGGLIGKHAMSFGADTFRIQTMVAIATPFGGSRYAQYFRGPTLRAFSPADATLVHLMHTTAVNARITSVYPRFDPHVPEQSALLGAHNVCVDTGGHFRILAHPRTLAEIRLVAASASGDRPD
ncbi:triacylglycerol lipase [Leucobacter luti]|uniref:esterase/lipase family protein n=1 Tax=Leucobacter luti TaxID=340320 RepID=UPI001C68B560|nr:alpha/beta hydrolase [Leucobacter luti]QYM76941.1 alpha/beta hydrolase [Leucobacter luti]